MAIECVNTIEIRLVEIPDSAFSHTAQSSVAALRCAPGCIDYILVRSVQDEGLWWLTGYWQSQSQMHESFESVAMTRFINCLIEEGASLGFGSFVPLPAAPHAH